jgi:hypothetical protein
MLEFALATDHVEWRYVMVLAEALLFFTPKEMFLEALEVIVVTLVALQAQGRPEHIGRNFIDLTFLGPFDHIVR